MNNSLQLTFGLELECIVRYNPDHFAVDAARLHCGSLMTQEKRFAIIVRKHIVEVLEASGLPTTPYQEDGSPQLWEVTHDKSITWEGQHNWVGVEIKSPAYNLSREALAQVEAAIEKLNNNFDVIVNDSCGLHVHVGNQRKGFPLQTLKQFCMLTTVFEPHFNSLHPSKRIFGSGSGWAKGPTGAFLGINPWDTAMLIQEAQNHESIVTRYAKKGDIWDRFQAYNLIPLVDHPMFQTIEFRQHEATNDPTVICKWIALACGIVEKAHTIPYDCLVSLIYDFAFDPRPSTEVIVDLLDCLQLNEAAKYYSQRGRCAHRRPPHAWVDKTLEDGFDIPPKASNVEFVDGQEIVKTLSVWGAVENGYIVIKDSDKPRVLYFSSSKFDRRNTKGASATGLSEAERQLQAVPTRLLNAEGQRIQEMMNQIPRFPSREIKRGEVAAGCGLQSSGLNTAVYTNKMSENESA